MYDFLDASAVRESVITFIEMLMTSSVFARSRRFDNNSCCTELLNSVFFFFQLDFDAVIEEINDKHSAPWAAMCQESNVTNTPLSSFLHKEHLYEKHLNLDGTKLAQLGFTCQHPKVTKELVLEVFMPIISWLFYNVLEPQVRRKIDFKRITADEILSLEVDSNLSSIMCDKSIFFCWRESAENLNFLDVNWVYIWWLFSNLSFKPIAKVYFVCPR